MNLPPVALNLIHGGPHSQWYIEIAHCRGRQRNSTLPFTWNGFGKRPLSRRHCLSLVSQHLAALASPDSETGTGPAVCGGALQLQWAIDSVLGLVFEAGAGGGWYTDCCCAIDMAIDYLDPGQVRVGSCKGCNQRPCQLVHLVVVFGYYQYIIGVGVV